MAENARAAKSSGQKLSGEKVAVVSERQLIRIEAVHRGFLYQHLYGAACLLLAGAAGVERVVVERDEDVEVVLPDRRIYVQVKTRFGNLSPSDIAGALKRFAEIREEHRKGVRAGDAGFVIAANAAPSAPLLAKITASDWPQDVELHWPDGPAPSEPCLPMPLRNVAEAIAACSALASALPFALLRPETLTWRLCCKNREA